MLPSRLTTHVADGAREVLGLVVGQPVGADHDRAAAELDVAFGHGVEVGPAAHLAACRMIGRRFSASPRGGGAIEVELFSSMPGALDALAGAEAARGKD